MAETGTETNTYQMLWDCPHCRTAKLLALTHRHCPSCGAPQDAQFRYFPSDSEKVKVENHAFVGKDIVCRYCSAYNGRQSQHCGECGSPLTEGAEAKVRAAQLHAAGQFKGEGIAAAQAERAGVVQPLAKPKKRIWPWVAAVLGVLTLIVVVLSWKREGSLTVAGHTWSREIEVQKFGPVRESTWCDSLPAGARELGRKRAVRKHEAVKVGEDCALRKVDQGDGTFREEKQCTDRTEDKPVMDDKCDYEITKWSVERVASAKGESVAQEPSWPVADVGPACERIGCRREGKRTEVYTVMLRADDGEQSECEFDANRWKGFKPGEHYAANVSVVGGRVDCDSLRGK